MASDLRDIVDQMAAVGIFVPADYELKAGTAKFQRFRPADQKKNKKSAWYIIYENFTKSGKAYYSGAFGIRDEKYIIKASTQDWTSEERKEAKEFAKQAQIRNQKDASERAQKAAQTAEWMWSRARDEVPVTFKYCVDKKIKPYGARFLHGNMIIPMYRGKMVGMQTILAEKNEDGVNKIFLTGSDIVGAYFKIGSLSQDPQQTVYVVEGYATGCSVHHATKLPVIVAFNAGNIEPVIAGIRAKMPDAKIVIAGDDDRHVLIRARAFFEKFGVKPEISASSKDKKQYFHTEHYGDVEVVVGYARIDGSQSVTGYVKYTLNGRQIDHKLNFANAGKTKALAAAKKHNCCVVFPVFSTKGSKGTDFNDLEVEEGSEVCTKQLDASKLNPINDGKAKKTGRASIDYLCGRYVLMYGRDDVWDYEKCKFVKLDKLRPWWGKNAVDMWLESPKRKSATDEDLVFIPSGKVPEGCINMFQGWPIKPDSSKSCHLIVEHLYNLCGRDDAVFDWVTKWLAYPLQHPGAKMHTCLLFYGSRQGTGKNQFFEQIMQRIYGPLYSDTINQAMLQSSFNAWLSHKLYCVGDEVVASADRRILKNQLKTMITGLYHQLNEKNIAGWKEPNLTNFVFLSNEDQPLLLDMMDRRHMCVIVNESHPQAYFDALAAEANSGGVEAFYQYLLDYPLQDFAPSTKPLETQGHQELIRMGVSADRRFIEDWLNGDTEYPVGPVAIIHLYQAFQMWAKLNGERFLPNMTNFGIALGHFMPSARKRVKIFAPGQRIDELSVENSYGDMLDSRQLTIYLPEVPRDKYKNHSESDQIACYVREFQLKVIKNTKNLRIGEY